MALGVIKHPACKMTPNGRGWGGKESGGGLEGMGRWVGMQETPIPTPYFTRLPFFSCCQSKLQHVNLLSPECTTQIEAGYDDDDHDHKGYGDDKLG